MKAKIWISLVALIVAISALCYALYLFLQVKTDADIMMDDYQDLQKQFANEETTKMAERSESPGQAPTSEGGSGEADIRP